MLRKYYYARFRLKNELKIERLQRKKTKELNEMKMRFFTNISHEIRTPLTLILGPIQELIESGEGSMTIREHLRNINKNANRLLTLVNQLLEFRKQESGFTKLQIAKADIVKFISEVILSFKELAHRRNIDFNFIHDPEVIAVWYDSSQLEKVFFNLLSNAFKFTSNGGMIEVMATKSDDKVKIVVTDNGKGISKDDLPFIFDRFHKFNKDYSGNYLGSGIGLALVKGIIDLHKGSIQVESELNTFTKFTIELPLGMKHFKDEEIITDYKDSEDASHYIIHSQDENRQENAGIQEGASQLLIVEDNDDVRSYLVKLFSSLYKIREAANGKEGWKMALDHSPDLIISDIMMPEMDGLQFCKKLKTSLETSHIPIILITARSSSFYKAKGLETGADDYITKPFDPKLLKIRVHNLIDSRKRLREKFNRNIALEPQEISITSPDQELLKKAITAVEKHMDDSAFDVNGLATEIGVSRPVLYRKLPAITDSTPNEFIRIIRLKRAAQILSQIELPISEVCYKTGFNTPKHFSKCFRDLFGVLPSEYAKREKAKRKNQL
jgi:DNA-binding response OmpR family regulator/nitrogen-specific signal transduction histidine kinase